MFLASDAKILLIAFNFMMFALRIPAALLRGIGKGSEDAFRLDGIAALDDKCVVDNGLLVHGLLTSKGNS